MEKINYESLYKFFVSIGVALIALPFVVVGLMYGIEPTLISQDDYNNLSQYSKDELSSRESIRSFFANNYKLIIAVFVIIGIAFITIGIIQWIKAHKLKFKEESLNVEEHELIIQKISNELKQMSDTDVENEVSEEVDNDKALINYITLNYNLERSNIEPNNQSNEENVIRQESEAERKHEKENTINKYIRVEKACFQYVKSKLGNEYDCRRNVYLERRHYAYSMDIVAISKTDEADIIYEIKYYKNPISILSSLSTALFRIIAVKNMYETKFNRTAKLVLLVVTESGFDNEIRKIKDRLVTQYDQGEIEIRFITVKDLGLDTRD